MKVILKENIKSIGKKDEIINVSDGYARNYLFAKNLAVEATNSNLAKLKSKKESEQYKDILFRSIRQKTSKSFAKIEVGLHLRLYEDISEILDPLGTLDPSQPHCFNHDKTCLKLISRLERLQ